MARKYKSLADYFDQTGTTQDVLAAKVGVTRNYLSMIAAGKRQPTLPIALELSRITGIPVESLVLPERVAS